MTAKVYSGDRGYGLLLLVPIILMGILVQARVLTLPPSVYAWSVTFVIAH